jgi:hypothetical protein
MIRLYRLILLAIVYGYWILFHWLKIIGHKYFNLQYQGKGGRIMHIKKAFEGREGVTFIYMAQEMGQIQIFWSHKSGDFLD